MSQAELTVRQPRARMAGGPAARHATPLFLGELRLVFTRTRNQVLLGALGLIPLALGLALRFAGSGGDGSPGGVSSFLGEVTDNGLFLVFASLLVTLPIFLPMALGVVAGDSIAGEASMGTLRYLLVAPAGRTKLLLAKALALVMFCLAATLVVAGVGLATGVALFPVGRVSLLSGDSVSFGDAMARTALIALLVAASLLGLAAMGLFVSTLTSTPLAAMATTVGLPIVAQILDSVPQLHEIGPYLFLHHWLSFADVLRQPMYLHDIGLNLLTQLIYVLVFGSAAWARLTARDISA